ncbi:MAG: demethylmenaquinone methyltransferase [Propionibacteriaceae bacterium]|jgi:demethylmenaquinone methyltransferase/2-methoxy-6-polyprenyl-1,4-benzoquinol methylase|nr:demethylmenaquinone methyltransferase [Propionibacteriaceae bacterium]
MPKFRTTLEKDRDEVAQMFDAVARRYDLVNDMLSLGQDRLWRKQLVKAVAPRAGQRILDLAAGTGTSTLPLAATGAQAIAADISLGMLIVGKDRYRELDFINTDALALPFPDAAFDAVSISFGLRNIADTVAALTEMRRVAKPGGRLVICEFSTPAKPLRGAYRQYLTRILPQLAKLASSNPAAYEYLTESILDWPDQHQLANLMAQAGWKRIAWKNLTTGIVALHRGFAG